MCEVVLHTEEGVPWPRRVGVVSPAYVAVLAGLTEADAVALALSSWREAFSYLWATPDVLFATIDAWRGLARQAVAEDEVIVMEWYD